MADWAIVIGVDKYWQASACLRGAVRDALEMRRWLIESARVPETNFQLLLAPDVYAVPEGLSYTEPTDENISKAITKLIEDSGARGERLYFYYAGHGLSVRVNYRDEDALVCSNFTNELTTRSLGLESIVSDFAATELSEQFFFIDACRNIPYNDEFRIGYRSRPRKRDFSKCPVHQYVMYATSPGLTAKELRPNPGDERGAFTSSLLEGLRGKGDAKAWDSRDEEYVVRFDRLFRFVVKDVEAKRLNVGGKGSPLFQSPRSAGERGGIGNDPILARFPDAHIASEALKVHIHPFDPAVSPSVVVQREGVALHTTTGIAAIPIEFQLRPKEYRVSGAAKGFISKEPKGWWVELWEPREVSVELIAGKEVGDEPLTRGLAEEAVLAATGTSPSEAGTIEIYSFDELAALEIYDGAGVLLATGRSRVRFVAPPGIYRGVLRVPDAPAMTANIDLSPGEFVTIAIDAPAPSRGVLELINSDPTAYPVERDRTVLISETSGVGRVAGAQLTTILAMAAGAALSDPDEVPAFNLRNLGLRTLKPNMPEAVTLLLADETAASAAVQQARVRFWADDESMTDPRPLLPIRSNMAEYGQLARPGAYRMALEIPGLPSLLAPVMIHPRHSCIIAISRDSDDSIRMFEYLPSTAGGDTARPRFLRRLEWIQRYYTDNSFARARELLELDVLEPVTHCLAGYTLLHLGKAGELADIARQMTTELAAWSDSWIIHAEHELASGNVEEAKRAYRAALDRGIPLIADGVALLRDAAYEFGLEHPRLPDLERIFAARVRHTVWTAWFDEALATPRRPRGRDSAR